MSFNCGDCGDDMHACMAWDGHSSSWEGEGPNHNLVKECPTDITKYPYRLKKTKSKELK